VKRAKNFHAKASLFILLLSLLHALYVPITASLADDWLIPSVYNNILLKNEYRSCSKFLFFVQARVHIYVHNTTCLLPPLYSLCFIIIFSPSLLAHASCNVWGKLCNTLRFDWNKYILNLNVLHCVCVYTFVRACGVKYNIACSAVYIIIHKISLGARDGVWKFRFIYTVHIAYAYFQLNAKRQRVDI
jgi:hypothetical protein